MRTNKRVSAIVLKNDNILLIHRRKYGDEYWVVPGGGVEDGETLEQGLIREVKEETSLEVKKYSLIATYREILTFDNQEKEIEHYFYKCELSAGEPTLGGPEAEANSDQNWFNLEWVDIASISNLDLYPNYLKQINLKKKIISVANVVLIDSNNRLLLLKRSQNLKQPGFWGLPGGLVSTNENTETAAIRELEEETGIQKDSS